ncbi:hypothetical protein Goarm_003271, partial [Gossypium armourianum]|nr:hypothetical protein [Gossypium armourianum]
MLVFMATMILFCFQQLQTSTRLLENLNTRSRLLI